jgi:hypothetical protein
LKRVLPHLEMECDLVVHVALEIAAVEECTQT